MSFWEKVVTGLKRYGGFLLFVLGVVLGIFLFKRRMPGVPAPATAIKTELAGIRAEAAFEKRQAEIGHQNALEEIHDAYALQKDAMDVAERAEATALLDDPQRLAGFLARAGVRRSR